MPVSQDIGYVVKVTHQYFVHADAASTRDAFLELQERGMYMERILKHAFKGIALDTKSLGQMALSIEETEKGPQTETDEAELAVEEECTIDPVEDTVTRELFLFHSVHGGADCRQTSPGNSPTGTFPCASSAR
jgi:hypothetical protein